MGGNFRPSIALARGHKTNVRGRQLEKYFHRKKKNNFINKYIFYRLVSFCSMITSISDCIASVKCTIISGS
jgi:hypothetical protein